MMRHNYRDRVRRELEASIHERHPDLLHEFASREAADPWREFEQYWEAATVPPAATSSMAQRFWAAWARQLGLAKRMFEERRYGCWCGPGNVCNRVTDNIDRCCKIHDEAYASAGVTSGSGSGINMWTIEGLKRTRAADLELVRCTQATLYDPHWYGPAAALYRTGVALIFGTRAAAASAAIALGL